MELNVVKLFFKTFKSALPIIIIIIISFTVLISFIFNNFIKYNQADINQNKNKNEIQETTF